MNTQNNPIKETSVLSAAGVKSGVMILKLIALSLLGVGGAYASEALFTDTSSVVITDTSLQSSPEIKRSRVVTLNPESIALDQHSTSTPKHKQIELNLFDDVSYKATIEEVEYRSAGDYTEYGKIDGIDSSNVILTVVDGNMVANIITPQRKIHVSTAKNGQAIVSEIDQSQFPNEKEEPSPLEVTQVKTVATTNLQITPLATTTPTDDGSIIDVLVVYTTDAKNNATAEGKNILTEIQSYIDETNAVYKNSGVYHRLRRVGSPDILEEKNYTESYISTALYDLTFQGGNFSAMDDVFAKRDSVAADMVVLITQTQAGVDASNSCGDGWLMNNPTDVTTNKPLAFSVVSRSCAKGNYSFAHVTAKNLGAKPDCDANSSPAPSNLPYTYSHGYVDTAHNWRTVMAYNNTCSTCQRIPYFSNPNVNYNGAPTGAYTGITNANGCTKDSHNTRTFSGTTNTDGTAKIVAQYYNGYCDVTGYVARTDFKPGTLASNLYLRLNPLAAYYLQLNTADARLTDTSVKALTHHNLVTVRGNRSCILSSPPYNNGGVPSYLYFAP